MALEFEHTFRFTEEHFVVVEGTSNRKRRWVRMLAVIAGGVACLFWSYTLFLGVSILVLIACMRLLNGFYARHVYGRSPYLGERTTYGINDDGLWLTAPSIEARVPWSSVYLWEERGTWLRLNAYGVSTLWFPIRTMKDAGVYDAVMEPVTRFAARFGSPEARRLSRQTFRKRKPKPDSAQ